MYVFRFAATRTDMLLVEVGAVCLFELREHRPHVLFRTFCDQSCDRKQRLVRVELRSRREVLLHDLPLMEVTYLHRDAVKNARNTAPSVEDDRFDCVSKFLHCLPQERIFELRLTPQLSGVYILAFIRIASCEDAVFTPEERRVDDENHGARTMHLLRQFNGVEELGDRARGETGIDTKLRLRALAADEFFP